MIKRSYRHTTLKARASLAQGGHGLEALERIAPFRFPISESAGRKPLESGLTIPSLIKFL